MGVAARINVFPFERTTWSQPEDRVAPGLSILYVGPRSGTSLQRAQAFRELGHDVVHVHTGTPRTWRLPDWIDPIFTLYRVVNKVRPHPDFFAANRRVRWAAQRRRFDVVWVDKGLSIAPATLAHLRAQLPDARFVSYSPDDMHNPVNQSPQYLRSVPLYDLHVTTKSYNVAELREIGAREALFVDNAFDPATHRPVSLAPEEEASLAADVGFVGWFEPERAEWLFRLAEAGLRVTVRGPDWRHFEKSHPLFTAHDEWIGDADYARVLCATKINLGFLRKANRDVQTTRSIEIPACRAFMLAERTDEHRRLFREGKEAEFFASFDELLAKCRHYLAHDRERHAIAAAGYRRCHAGYSNAQRLAGVLAHLGVRPRALASAEAPLRLAFAR